MIPLLLLIAVSGEVQGQTHGRPRQGFRPRGFVLQEPAGFSPSHFQQDPTTVIFRQKQQYQLPHNHREGRFHPDEATVVKNHHKRHNTWNEEKEQLKLKSITKEDRDQWPQESVVTERQPHRYRPLPHPQPFHRPQTTPIPIIRLDKEQSLDGSYKSSYETGNNIIHEETGFMKQMQRHGKPDEMLVQQGSYSYTDKEGNIFTVRYTADDQGFRAHGDHFPTPPPIPPEIQRGLDIIYEQIRLDAERRSHDKKEDDDNKNDLDNEGEYSTQNEQVVPYNKHSDDHRDTYHYIMDSNGQNEQRYVRPVTYDERIYEQRDDPESDLHEDSSHNDSSSQESTEYNDDS